MLGKFKRMQSEDVNSFQHDNHSNQVHGRSTSKLVITKVEKWSEFFDEDEINSGFEHMKKQPDDQLTELTEEPGSDSEPSVDNFDQTELKEMLGAALDVKEGEKDPFEKPKEE